MSRKGVLLAALMVLAGPAVAAPPIYRQRYECRACGFHGTREADYPPSHIPCPRCGGAADQNGPAELVR